jgi:hypothetical protein
MNRHLRERLEKWKWENIIRIIFFFWLPWWCRLKRELYKDDDGESKIILIVWGFSIRLFSRSRHCTTGDYLTIALLAFISISHRWMTTSDTPIPGGTTEPPNYRPQENKRKSCSTCHYSHHISLTAIRCIRYGIVRHKYVCDDYQRFRIWWAYLVLPKKFLSERPILHQWMGYDHTPVPPTASGEDEAN